MTYSPEQKRARLEALTKLAIATREKVERETFGVYLESLDSWSTGYLVEACRRLQRTATWFPKVAEIMECCRTVERERQIVAESRRLAPAEFTPIPKEKFERFLADIRAAINRHDLARPRPQLVEKHDDDKEEIA